MTSITFKLALFKTINQYKKLHFEIQEEDFKYLQALFNKKYENRLEGPILPTKPFYEYNGKYYADVSLNRWQTDDRTLMKLPEKVDPNKECALSAVIEFYNFKGRDNLTKEGMVIRFVKMN